MADSSGAPADPALDHAEPEIRAERAYLATARAALHRMHHDVVTTETQLTAAAEDNDNYAERLFQKRARELRALLLVDLPDVPLFFGRLDFDPGAAHPGSTGAERLYIGRRHVHDGAGDPLVIDWRAPISTAFYRATRDDRQGVRLRRRYGFSGAAELTAYEDEPLAGPGVDGDRAGAFLAAEIERPRSGPMRDIVATIQPEQDDLVRAPLERTVCVQGAPGTGKTAVGLHRVAYLLYTERDRLGRTGIAVVGPNRSFLSYIRRVLPALGEVNVTQTTVEELIGRGPAHHREDPAVARLKGDARMAEVLHRALWSHVTRPAEGLVYAKGVYRHRVADHEVSEIVAGLRGAMRYGPGRAAAAKRIAHAVLVQMERRGESPDDRTHNAVARSKPVRQLLDAVWPKVTPEQVLFRLLSDAEFLARSARRDLTQEEQELLLWRRPPRSWRSAKWSDADTALLDELSDLVERTASIGHIVLDEAQDLSPMQCRAVGRRCATGSMTVLGDIAQGTAPSAVGDWAALLRHLGKPDARLETLERGYRVPAQIIDFAARLLPEIAPGLGAPTSARRSPGALRVAAAAPEGLPDAVAATCREHLKGEGSIGVITADAALPALHQRLLAEGLEAASLEENENAMEDARLVCVPATLAKGLEFDTVVLVEPAGIVNAEPRGLHRLYVALTRAVSALHVLHAAPLPAALREAA
ncbi:HelD family protein [Actinomadura rugatobispora]|uniref:HelD family protein n=1 Tax=Actinomadura rugatobispora TaxID=1994 RepID=A0ABW1A864_9ACTN|nr:AAA family ATPase [Actinomadura rugatobispora]